MFPQAVTVSVECFVFVSFLKNPLECGHSDTTLERCFIKVFLWSATGFQK